MANIPTAMTPRNNLATAPPAADATIGVSMHSARCFNSSDCSNRRRASMALRAILSAWFSLMASYLPYTGKLSVPASRAAATMCVYALCNPSSL